jgi:predicted RNase H-like HicB family nuclease
VVIRYMLDTNACIALMKYRAVIKKSGDWWIGWLIDLPGVNAQEKTKKKVIESLRIGAEDILATDVSFDPNTEMATIDVPDPAWA